MNSRNNMTSPLVSVVLPTYNRPALLSLALDSIIHQTYHHYECIVVNDHPCTRFQVDNIVAEKRDSRFKVIHNPVSTNGTATRNIGIKEAKGEIIAFLDDDDQWLPKYLNNHVIKHQIDHRVGLVYSGVIMRWQDDLLPEKRLPSKPVPARNKIRMSLLNGKMSVFTTSAFTVKKRCLDQVGLFDESIPGFQDWELYYRISDSYLIREIKEPMTVFFQHFNLRFTARIDWRKQDLDVMYKRFPNKRQFNQFRQKYIAQTYFNTIRSNVVMNKRNLNIKLFKDYLASVDKPLNSYYEWKVTIKMLILLLLGKYGIRIISLF